MSRSLISSALAAGVVTVAACSTPGGPAAVNAQSAVPDPFLWLEDVTGERALAWVRERNAESAKVLAGRAEFTPLKTRFLEVMNSTDRIPAVRRIGAHVYNLWRDANNKRGLWRRTTLADYARPQPQWETVLDLDALGRAENENWVWAGAVCVPARADAGVDRCMIGLSRGGADAAVYREFDLRTRQFVADGFRVPEAKTEVDWIDRDTLYVASDFGPGSMTDSGYARTVREWKRGTPLSSAPIVFEGDAKDVAAGVSVEHAAGFERHLFDRALDFFRTELFILRDGTLVRIEKPDDAIFITHGPWAILQLRSAYSANGKTYPPGALLATNFDAYLRGERNFDVVFEPTAARALVRGGVAFTATRILLTVQDNVASKLEEHWHEQGTWHQREVKAPFPGSLSVQPLHDSALASDAMAETYLMDYQDFLTPATLYLGQSGSDELSALKRAPSFFDSQGMRVEQHFAVSKDGTRVPYFAVLPKGAIADASNPTLLYGYGGFQISMRPGYSAAVGSAWLAKGGVFVSSNIRGGGEFGPEWHTAALKEHKQRSYDDFIAVAEDLVRRKITSPQHLGIMGGSNGGLLVGAAFTQRPDLFGAVVCQVPLLDMARYNKLLAGASWMAEYGDPDQPEQWAYISKYSPYQNVVPTMHYPRVLFTTSTRDDRVHPAHARKMAARMAAQGHDVLYYENIEGGHGGAADNEQRANLQALEFSYLWMQLGRGR
jgi:prolyl oligopeptidase